MTPIETMLIMEVEASSYEENLFILENAIADWLDKNPGAFGVENYYDSAKYWEWHSGWTTFEIQEADLYRNYLNAIYDKENEKREYDEDEDNEEDCEF